MRDSKIPNIQYSVGTLAADSDIVLVRFTEHDFPGMRTHERGGNSFVIAIEPEALTRRKLATLVRKMVAKVKEAKIKKIALDLSRFMVGLTEAMSMEELAELVVTNIEMANYEFVYYKSPPKEGWPFIEEVMLRGGSLREIADG